MSRARLHPTCLTAPTVFGAVLIILLSAAGASAQFITSPTDGSTPLGLTPGAPAGSFSLSGFESVNPYNGNLNFALPLLGVGGRGGAHMTVVLKLDSKGWHFRHGETTDPNTGLPLDTYYPEPNYWSGLTPGYGPGVLVGRQSGGNDTWQCTHSTYAWSTTLTRLTFTASDGTEYELRDQQTGGQPLTGSDPCHATPPSRGTLFVTGDGSAATFISDAPISDRFSTQGGGLVYPSGYLTLRDGTRYRIDNGLVTWLRDRNGNMLTFLYDPSGNGRVTTITDSLGRQVTFTYADFSTIFYDQISYSGFGGAARTVRVNYATLSSVLRQNYGTEPASHFQLQTYAGLFPGMNGSSSTYFNPWVVSSVVLPNGQQYQLLYNSYAELARVVLPTGGAIEYDYTPGSGTITDGVDYHVYRRVLERRVYPDGVNLESYTTFSDLTSGVATVDQYGGGGTLLTRTKHYFNGDPVGSLMTATGISYPAKLDGREYKTESYAADGTTLLRSEQMTWANRAPVSWWQNPGGDDEPPNDPRVTDTTAMLADVTPNLMSKHVFGYDDSVPYNNRNDVKEYDFGAGAPGALVRETRTTYVTSSAYTDAVSGAHLRSLPAQSSIYDSAGVERSRVTYEYDNYASDTNHAPLQVCPPDMQTCPGFSGLDATYTSSLITRGNVTGTTHYLLDASGTVVGSVFTYTQYDVSGNAVKAVDSRGSSTLFDYRDRFGAPDGEARANSGPTELSSAGQASYAFATSVTNALGQTSYLQFDYYLGRPVDAEDSNGTTYSAYFNDALDRPTQVVLAANSTTVKSQSTFAYDDADRVVTATGDQTTYGDNLLKGQTVYDGLGRTVEARTYETGTQYISVQQVPFVVLQDPDTLAPVAASQSSNPYRPYLGESAVWTTGFFDPLGRATKTRTPDSAVARVSYAGNTTTASDQVGRARESVKDALGRLRQVYEDPNGADYFTSYDYDVLDNLTAVHQGSQTRTFVYDSLKRLSSATNPENGTTSYQYDADGNLLVRTDARGASAHYSYDALNRVTRRWYNGSSASSATTNNSPALPSTVAPTDEVSYAYDTSTNGKGRLASVSSSAASYSYSGYDALGRVLGGGVTIGAQTYPMSYSYDLAGHPKSMTYPSGHVINNGFDSAGRLNSFTGTLGEGAPRTYSTGISYSPFGGLSQEQLGTATPIYNKLFYNSRGQLSEIREGLTPNDTTWERGAIINNYSNTCWGMCSGLPMTDNDGDVKKQEHWIQDSNGNVAAIFTQKYDYDGLNRLQRVYDGDPTTPAWQQRYVYDRYGNRTIDQANTSAGLDSTQFDTGDAQYTNRLYAPGDTSLPAGQRRMQYDAAGNLTYDSYTGQGARTYDAENRMKQAWSGGQWQMYSYDAGGRRAKRVVNGVETWEVYGLGGELLAEYAAGAGALNPQKEYGYRGGQLLVTATVTGGWGPAPAFDDNPLNPNHPGETPVRAAHITQLRSAIDSLRSHLGLSGYAWGAAPQVGDPVTTTPITEMRAAIDQALGPPPAPGYTGGLASHQPILAAHIQELRNRVLATWQGGAVAADVRWLVADHLGTPRMAFDQSGSLSGVSRHDYLPFGGELSAGVGGRTPQFGYTGSDKARQQFTAQERDAETGLDFMQARYYSPSQGRFTGPDTLAGTVTDPQTFNRYSYVSNNPANFSDPTGHTRFSASENGFNEAMAEEGGGYMSPDNPDSDLGLPQRYEDEIARIKELIAEDEAAADEAPEHDDADSGQDQQHASAPGTSTTTQDPQGNNVTVYFGDYIDSNQEYWSAVIGFQTPSVGLSGVETTGEVAAGAACWPLAIVGGAGALYYYGETHGNGLGLRNIPLLPGQTSCTAGNQAHQFTLRDPLFTLPRAVPMVPPIEMSPRRMWTCLASGHETPYGNTPGAGQIIRRLGYGPSRDLAAEAARNAVQAASRPGYYMRHVHIIDCW